MTLPPAADCHVHVVDAGRWPYVAGPGYKPGPDEQGDADALDRTLAAAGIGRALLVQPSAYGTDNRAMLDAIDRGDGRLRGIAVLDAATSAAEMHALAGRGVVGLRLNLGSFDPAFLRRPEAEGFLDRAAEAGLFVEVYAVADAWTAAAEPLARYGARLIVDHFGHPDCGRPLDQPGFRAVLDLGREGSAVVKLSSGFRVSSEPWPHADTDAFAAAALAAFGAERCVWGSDWPFVDRRWPVDYPGQRALAGRWLPDPAVRDTVLGRTPDRLFFGGPG